MDKVKWGVIGCGGIANTRTIPGMLLAENATLVAVMDIDASLAEQVGKKYEVPFVCDSVDVILAQDIDAVYIATPVFCHKEQAIAAMRAGKHILIEKPVGLTVEEVKELRDIAQQENVKIGVGMMMRFHTYHQKMKEIIAAGKMGDIVSMRAQFTCWYPEIKGSWRQIKKLSGGGALIDLGVHAIDLLQYVSGLTASGICAMCDTQTFQYEVDDSASLLLKMNNGAHAYVDVNFNIPDEAVKSRLEIYGTKGSLIADDTLSQVEDGSARITLLEEADQEQENSVVNSYFLESAKGNMYTKEIESFSYAVMNDTKPAVSIEDAIVVQQITEAAYCSSETGRYVALK